jgi:hypothetical protein
MKILLLEDDELYAETIDTALKDAFKGVEVVRLTTEREFRQKLTSLATGKFSLAIFDIMIRWGDAEELSDAPHEVKEEAEGKKKWRAGLRCRKLFNEAVAKHGGLPIPSFYHSVLDAHDLANDELNGETELVVKQGNIELLTNKVRELTQRHHD